MQDAKDIWYGVVLGFWALMLPVGALTMVKDYGLTGTLAMIGLFVVAALRGRRLP